MDMIGLASGDEVPKACVDALDAFEQKWPGASFHNARPALAVVVRKELEKLGWTPPEGVKKA